MADSKKFLVIGHRGAAGERLENSLAGFEHAAALKPDGIELDLREQHGEFWVFHDDELERLTGTVGRFHEQQDIGALQLRNGQPVPTLRQVLDLTWNRVPLNIEIKSIANPAALLELLAAYPAPRETPALPWNLISSFDHGALLRLRELDCPWPLAPLSDDIPGDVEDKLAALAPWSWHFWDRKLDFDLVERLAARGVRSLVYTVNDGERALELKRRGVDGIFTDQLSRLRHLG